jgi:hypothetical protein
LSEKTGESLDDGTLKSVYWDKVKLVKELKDKALYLGTAYGECIKIELDVNPMMKSVKMSIKEFL